jgi:hypothetical protein
MTWSLVLAVLAIDLIATVIAAWWCAPSLRAAEESASRTDEADLAARLEAATASHAPFLRTLSSTSAALVGACIGMFASTPLVVMLAYNLARILFSVATGGWTARFGLRLTLILWSACTTAWLVRALTLSQA